MVAVRAEDYEDLKGFLAWFNQHLLAVPDGLPADQHPIAVLSHLEAQSMSIARKGLRMAIGDLIEDTADLSAAQVRTIDEALAARALPSLTSVRLQFWSKIHGIVRRGEVRNETEYYALRTVVETMPGEERENGWRLLAAFENNLAPTAK